MRDDGTRKFEIKLKNHVGNSMATMQKGISDIFEIIQKSQETIF